MEGGAGLLGQGEVLLAEVVDGLVLVDFHAGAHVAVPMQEEAEGAREVLTVKGERVLFSFFVSVRSILNKHQQSQSMQAQIRNTSLKNSLCSCLRAY